MKSEHTRAKRKETQARVSQSAHSFLFASMSMTAAGRLGSGGSSRKRLVNSNITRCLPITMRMELVAPL